MSRWITSLHEAGHAVAGFVLTGTRVVMTLHEGGGGAAWPLKELSPTDGAIMAAAGPLAEPLAARHEPPEIPGYTGVTSPFLRPALPTLESAGTPETTAELKRDLEQVIPDHVAIARWCIADFEREPERWAQRHAFVHALAQRIIRDHEQSIVEAARVLYLRGVVSVPLFERSPA